MPELTPERLADMRQELQSALVDIQHISAASWAARNVLLYHMPALLGEVGRLQRERNAALGQVAVMLVALERTDRMIESGLELGYVEMGCDVGETREMVKRALAALAMRPVLLAQARLVAKSANRVVRLAPEDPFEAIEPDHELLEARLIDLEDAVADALTALEQGGGGEQA